MAVYSGEPKERHLEAYPIRQNYHNRKQLRGKALTKAGEMAEPNVNHRPITYPSISTPFLHSVTLGGLGKATEDSGCDDLYPKPSFQVRNFDNPPSDDLRTKSQAFGFDLT